MNQIKPVILSGLYHLKYFDILRHLQKNRVIILMYHRFSDKFEPFKIQQNVFENQIKFLLKKYNFISLKHYSKILTGKRNDFPDNPIILTIDDGYWDKYTFAYPILKKYSIPATIFITTDFISHKAWLWSNKLEYILKNSKLKEFDFELDGKIFQFQVDNFKNWHRSQLKIFNFCRTIGEHKKNEFLNELTKYLKVDVPEQTVGDFQPLTWDQIKEMQHNGIDFGSHTCSHPILSMVTSDQLKHEIIDSKREIECKLGVDIASFSYPNGKPEDINDTVIEMTRKAGYSCAVTTIQGFNDTKNSQRLLLKRIQQYTDNKTRLSRELVRLI